MKRLNAVLLFAAVVCLSPTPVFADLEDIIYITPPMDVNRSKKGSDIYSLNPLEIRTSSGRGLFGARRYSSKFNKGKPGNSLLRFHEGVDLLCQAVHDGKRKEQKVFAAATGRVIGFRKVQSEDGKRDGKRDDDAAVYIQHYPLSAGIVSRYLHLGRIEGKWLSGLPKRVEAGELLGAIKKFQTREEPTHLHFELRRTVNRSMSATNADEGLHNSKETVAIDPTPFLYRWEELRYLNDSGRKTVGPTKLKLVEEVVRGRGVRLFSARIGSTDYFIPLYQPTTAELSMVQLLRDAFMNGKKVRLVWRESLLLGERKVIVEARVQN